MKRRRCRDCHADLYWCYFRRNASRTSGRSSRCRDCDNQHRRRRRHIRTRVRLFALFGQRYCRYCRRGQRPEAFSTDRGPLPPMCDTCLAIPPAQPYTVVR